MVSVDRTSIILSTSAPAAAAADDDADARAGHCSH